MPVAGPAAVGMWSAAPGEDAGVAQGGAPDGRGGADPQRGGGGHMTSKVTHTVLEGSDGSAGIEIHARGMAVLDDPQINRGTAFTHEERDYLGLHGLLPSGLETIEEQVGRCYEQFNAKGSDVEKWVFLTQLHDSN